MNYRQTLIAAGFAVALCASAAPLTPAEALSRVSQNAPSRAAAMTNLDLVPVWTEYSSNGSPAAYVFNTPGAGYLVLSGDDLAYPVLGYSDSGMIDAASMPPSMKWWLGEYARQIEWAASKGMAPATAPLWAEGRSAVEPLLQTKWDQGKPYFNMCPEVNGVHTFSGCVATSMAQVMNYFKYPEVGEGTKKYKCASINKRLSINFAQRAFDWENMLDIYSGDNYTEAQADAVAYLMKACGYSVEMEYGTDSSGAHGFDIAPALRNYFKYDKSLMDCYRIIYSPMQWDEMMYNNLKEVGPVIINGQSPLEGGHSFVCDGYDGKGYYHFNWGWSGMSDGYYSLDALNPEAQGTGGFAGGFNFQQNAIFGIRPASGEPSEEPVGRIFQYGSSTATVSGNIMTFDATDYSPTGWGNLNYESLYVNIGAIIEGEGTQKYVQGVLGTISNISLAQGSLYPSNVVKPEMELPALADGTYKVTLASRPVGGSDSDWLPVEVPWGYTNYVMLDVADGAYTVRNISSAVIQFSDVENLTPMYAGKNILFKVKATNNSDIELCQGVSPRLCSSTGIPLFYGESVLITLQPGETAEKEIITKFYKKDGTVASVSSETSYIMKFCNPENGMYYEGVAENVTLLPNPGTASVLMTNFTIPYVLTEETTIDGRYFPMLAIIDDPSNIQVDFSFKVRSGYYDGLVSFNLARLDPNNIYEPKPIDDGIFSEMVFAEKNESHDISFTYDFSDAEMDVVYFIVAKYTMGNSVKEFGSKAFMYKDLSGVENVANEDVAEEYFNLQGMRVPRPASGEVVIVRKGDRIFKRIVK